MIASELVRSAWAETASVELAWIDPVAATTGLANRSWTTLLHSDGGTFGRWSYLCAEPAAARTYGAAEAPAVFADLRAVLPAAAATPPKDEPAPGIPPFTGGVVGLLSYEHGSERDGLDLPRDPDWPDAAWALYTAVLAFDHARRRCVAIGRGATSAEAQASAERASRWARPELSPSLSSSIDRSKDWRELRSGDAYEAAVADVIARIGAGELFQANVGRGWTGTLSRPEAAFSAFSELARTRAAPFGAWLRLPGLALVSNSPERFLTVRDDRVETRPIKGTRPRGRTAAEDAALASDLLSSGKDRAENLMIVDLMRNDLAQVCRPGSVEVAELFALESYATVHHLVSTVRGRLAEGADALDALAACFPPGSITGAPKVQAMKVLAAHEPPRGPWCGSLFRLGLDGALESSVLIRTAGFVETADGGWRYTARAGAGITADSDPVAERAETETKIAALRAVLAGERA